MSSLQIGRLLIGPPGQWYEQVGDPVQGIGGTVVAAPRTPLQHSVSISTIGADGQPDTVAARLRIRRQLRSLLNNTQLKSGAFVYVIYSDDPEQDGWYFPDQASLQDIVNSVGLATGFWNVQGNWYPVGHMRTHREARTIWMKDLRGGEFPRDTLGWIYSTDFAGLSALELTSLPFGATSIANTVNGLIVPATTQTAGRDGGACQIATGLPDLACVSFERPESALNLSDVIVYDRRGQLTAPLAGPDTAWEEVYGTDYAWSWLLAGGAQDTPALDNGLVRVRYDPTNVPGFRVDAWNGTTYVEQGKLLVYRVGDTNGFCDTFVSAGLHPDNGWTPDRAVMSVVLSRAADPYSREQILISMRRGQAGCTIECYPAQTSIGGSADVMLLWTPALTAGAADLNNSVYKSDTQSLPPAFGTGAFAGTAGTGAGAGNSGQFGAAATLGASSFAASENYVVLLRCPAVYNTVGAFQASFSVLQASNVYFQYRGADSNAYGVASDAYRVQSQGAAGYLQCRLLFSATVADQVNEAESILNSGSGTASVVTDSAASGGQAVRDTQPSPTAPTLKKTGASLIQAKYRVWARVRTDPGAVGTWKAVLGGTAGSAVVASPTTYAWTDLGEIVAGGSGEIDFYASGGTTAGSIAAPTGLGATPADAGGSMVAGTYHYKVTALKGSGETTGSGEATATIPADLPAPTGASATPSGAGGSLGGFTYYYKITAVNLNGETVGSSEVSGALTSTLAAPTGVGATGSGGGGTFTGGTYYYKVTALNANGETTGSSEVSATISTNLPAPTGVQAALATSSGTLSGGTYYYKVTALNASGETTGSSEVSATVAAIPAPTGVSATGAGTGTLSPGTTYYYKITATNGAGETTGSAEVSLVAGTGLSAPTGVSANIVSASSTLTTFQTYYYKITAVNATGETVGSAEVSATPNGFDHAIALAWTTVAGATGYKIYRSTASGGESTSPALIATLTGGGTSGYTDVGAALTAGSVPTTNTTGATAATLAWTTVPGATGYKVYRATTSGGEGTTPALLATVPGGSSSSYADTGTAVSAGAVPASNTTGGSGSVALAWNAVPGATGYNIYRAGTSGGEGTSPALITTIAGGGTTGYTDTGATAFAGAVPGSNTATITTGSVALAWSAVSGATSYKVYRATSSGAENVSPALVATVAAPTVAYADTGSAVTTGAVPASNTAIITTGSVALAWTAVVGATGYRIYRATSPGAENVSPALLIAIASGATTAYTDTGAVALTAGAVPASNTATITTGSVALAWTAVSGATGYNIYRSASSGGEGTTPAFVGTASTNSFTDEATNPTAGAVPGTNTTGGANVYIDRTELFLVEDRTRPNAAYTGARDRAQAALYDSRTLGALVAR